MPRRIAFAIVPALLGALTLGAPAHAQRGISRGFGPRPAPAPARPPMGSPTFRGGRGSFGFGHGPHSGFGFRRGGWGYGLGWGYPWFANYYDRGEEYARPDYEPPEPPPQQVMVEPSEPPKVIQ